MLDTWRIQRALVSCDRGRRSAANQTNTPPDRQTDTNIFQKTYQIRNCDCPIKQNNKQVVHHRFGNKKMNFKSFGNDPGGSDNGGGGRPPPPPPGNYSLARQSSVYSLTFDEFVSTMGGSGKDFGSMNMDELLKNIWTAEEVQTMGSTEMVTGTPGVTHLQRQGSLTLPRTLSQKTVDEVWKDISKDYGSGSGSGSRVPNLAQTERQPTLGEMTLEEFLVRAGVVREDAQLGLDAKPNDAVYGALGMGYQQLNKVNGLMGNRIGGGGGGVSNDSMVMGLQSPNTNLPLNVNGVRSSNQHQQMQQQQQQNSHSHQQQIFPKSYATQVPLASNQGIRGGIVGLSADQGLNGGNLVQGMVGVGLPPGPVHVPTGSPASQISSDKIGKSNGDTSSVSPVPYVFNGGMRGRKSGGPVEKVIERRQRRMIKNRESAARSRARKQAYTMELEAEVAKLKEDNQELRKKQAEIMEIQKNQVMEMMNLQREVKRRCLRRTLTGPW